MSVDDFISFRDSIPVNHVVTTSPNCRSIVIDSITWNSKTTFAELWNIFGKEIQSNPKVVEYLTTNRDTITAFLYEYIHAQKNAAPDLNTVFYTDCEKFPYNDTWILVCPSSPKRLIMFNHKTRDFEFVHNRYIKDFVALPKNIRPIYKNITEIYSPELPPIYSELTEELRSKFPYIRTTSVWNNYIPPAYKSLRALDKPSCPPLLVRFFKHLIPAPGPRKYVLQWLRTLVSDFESTLPILVLCGKAAIGKNTLVESIMVGLVGRENYHKAAQISERFNSSIADCILHFSDEGEVNGIVKRNLKGFHELYVAIERKGVDVINPERIYSRFVVATNNKRDISFDKNDRKFSVPELTTKKLAESFTAEDMEWLFSFKTNLEAQKDFYDYLVANYESTRDAYHGELFEQICHESLPAWFRGFLGFCELGEEFSFKDFKKRAGPNNLSIDTLINQIENYEHQLGFKVVAWRCEEGNHFFVPSNARGS